MSTLPRRAISSSWWEEDAHKVRLFGWSSCLGVMVPPLLHEEFELTARYPFPEYQHPGEVYKARLPWEPMSLDLVRRIRTRGEAVGLLASLPVLPVWSLSNLNPSGVRVMCDLIGRLF